MNIKAQKKLALASPAVSAVRFVPSLTEAQEKALGEMLVACLGLKSRKGKVCSAVYDTNFGEKSSLGLARVVVSLVDEALSLEGGKVA